MINRTLAPEIKDATEFNLQLKPYEKFTLDNGVEVYAINAGAQDVLQLEMIFYAGNSYEPANAIAAVTNHMLKNGTSTKTAFQINEHFEYYGSHCNRSCSNEIASVSLHTLNKHLNVLLPVMKEMITDSIFPEDELATYKQICKQKLSVSLQKCDFVANRLIDAYVFGSDHPYGKVITAADYDAITTDQLKQHFNKYYLNGKCVMFVAGLLPKDIFQQLNKNFGSLSLNKQQIILPAHQILPAIEKKYRIQNDANGVQGAIRMARPFPTRHHPDYMKTMVLNAVFG